MKNQKKKATGTFPLITMSNKKWWEKSNLPDTMASNGLVATQEQCSSGTGACNNTCGGTGK